MKKNNENFKVGRIMIVDDEAELMSALCDALAKQDYETQGFTAGADALKALTDQDYDLLLTDLMMPEMDGIALLKAGLEIDPNLVGVIMTGQGTVQTAVKAMKLGAFDYLLKPFKLAAILPLLSRAMEVRHLRMENMQLKETVAIHELGKAIAFSTDLSDILNKVADAALQQCDADEVSIMLPTRDGKELYVVIVRGGGHRSYIGERMPLDKGIAGWAARNREPVVLNGEVDDQRFSPINPRADIRAAVSMPMLAGGNLVGVLNVNIIRRHRHFTLGQVKTLSILVSIIAPILESTNLYIQVRQAEEKYRSIFENAAEGIYQTNPEGRFITANAAMATMLGYDSHEELMTKVIVSHQLYVNPEERTTLIQMLETYGRVEKFETRFYQKNGNMIWVSSNMLAVHDEKGHLIHYEGMAHDISERKRSLEALQESEEKYRLHFENVNDIIYSFDSQCRMLSVSPSVEKVLGYKPEELINRPIQDLNIWTPDGLEKVISDVKFTLTGKKNESSAYECVTRDRTKRFVEVSGAPIIRNGKVTAAIFVARDITERKEAEEGLIRERSMVDRIMKTSPAGIMVINRAGQIVFVNKRAEEIYGLTKNEITRLTHDANEWHITDYDGNPFPEEQLPFMQVMTTGSPVYGVRQAIELSDRRQVFLSINGAPIHDEQGNVSEVVLTIDDVTQYRQAEEEIEQSLKKLQKSMNDTIKAMSMVVETRDPYTAGHQGKVSKLAVAIANELHLSEEQIAGIRMAGATHDIGKISVPAEILSKPGRLTNIEFGLIKVHPASGYEILKDIEFPMPVAEIVLQHQERMDGSGYPRGLKGEEILIEARIIAVADVMDAIASHRPYRPAQGVDAALEEIEKNKGSLYDVAAVESCLKLFKEKRFQLE